VLGSAAACREVSPPRIKSMSDTLSDLITVSAVTTEESSAIWQAYNQSNTEASAPSPTGASPAWQPNARLRTWKRQ